MILIMIDSSQDLNMNTWRRRHPSSYCYGPVVQGRLLTHHSGGRHDDEEGLRWWYPSPAGCQEELLDPPDLASTTAGACSMFSEKEFRSLGFSRRGEYIGRRAMSGVDQAVTPPGGASKEGPAPPLGVAGVWSASCSPLDSVFVSGN
jgi:hypothetical protein